MACTKLIERLFRRLEGAYLDYAIQEAWKIIFKGKIDARFIPTDSAPGFEIVDTKITESAVEVWLSDGRIIITPLSWCPTLEAATPKQRRGFEILGVGLAWEELDLRLSVEGMLAGKREFRRSFHAIALRLASAQESTCPKGTH
jgi:hypothetical protein